MGAKELPWLAGWHWECLVFLLCIGPSESIGGLRRGPHEPYFQASRGTVMWLTRPSRLLPCSPAQKRGAQPLTLDIPRAAISEEPMKVPTAAAVEGTAVKATQSLSPIPPLQQPSAAPGDAASTTKAMSPVGWRAISPRSTPHAADSPSSSTCSTSGPPSPPTPLRPEAAVGEAARADPASQRQSQASVAGTAGDNRAPQPVLDGALLATCRPLSLLGEVRAGPAWCWH